MRNPSGGDLLIGALLDRLASAQAQALLARPNERRRERIDLHYLTESGTSQTSKEAQP